MDQRTSKASRWPTGRSRSPSAMELIEVIVDDARDQGQHRCPSTAARSRAGAPRGRTARSPRSTSSPAWRRELGHAGSLDRLAIRDPRAAGSSSVEAIAFARRIGRRDMELTAHRQCRRGRVPDRRMGRGRRREFAPLRASSRSTAPTAVADGWPASVIAMLRGADRDAELDALATRPSRTIDDNDFAQTESTSTPGSRSADGRFADGPRRLDGAWPSMSDLNAPYVLPRAAGRRSWRAMRRGPGEALDRLDALGGARPVPSTSDATRSAPGIAALDGRTQDAIAGFRAAMAGWRDLRPAVGRGVDRAGAPWPCSAPTHPGGRAVGRERPRDPRRAGRDGRASPSSTGCSATRPARAAS